MYIPKEKVRGFKHAPNCLVWQYELEDDKMSFAKVYIDGKYPKKGFVANSACKQLCYVTTGSCIIHSEKGDFKIGQSDVYYIDVNEKFWIDGQKVFLIFVNNPAWTATQYKFIGEEKH